jgi:hypothetical protein
VTEKSEDDTKGPHMTDPVPAASNVKEVRVYNLLVESPVALRENLANY